MNRRSLLRDAAAAVQARPSAPFTAPSAARADAEYAVALSTGMQPLLACLAQMAIELLARQTGAAPDPGGRQKRPADAFTEAA